MKFLHVYRMKVLDSVPEMQILGPVLFDLHCVWHGTLAIETTQEMFVDNNRVSSKSKSTKLKTCFVGFHPFSTPMENFIR